MMKKKLILSTLLLFTISCANQQTKPVQDGDNTYQASNFTVEDELKMTKEALTSMQKDYPASSNKEAQAYLNQLGNKIVKASNLHQNPYSYSFSLVDSEQINAFALPAGTVFVTTALFKAVGSEAELAGVVGHEIGHVQARHTAERMTLMQQNQKSNLAWTLGSAVVGAAGGFMLGKKLCKPQDKECLAKVTVGVGALGAGASLMVQKYQFMQNSQTDELEADRLGFKYATNAGFDAVAVGKFYEQLLEMEKKAKGKEQAYVKMFADAMSTHPPSEKRVAQMKKMASDYPKQGTLSGQKFLHIQMRLKEVAKPAM